MFDKNDDIFDKISSNKTSSIPNDQPPKKKVKLNKRRRRYAKISWVWRYFKLSDDETCVKCQVKTMNLRNELVLCSCKLQYDGGTGNMSNHLRNIHNLNETQDKRRLIFTMISSDDDSSSEDDNEDLNSSIARVNHYHQTRSVTNIVNQNEDYTYTKQIILWTLKHTIYSSLFDYWSELIMVGLLASLLDPQLKTLASWSDEIQEIAKNELTHQFKKLPS
ncbi:24498_t:CDS:2 [Racocetra persica]|uniref:24498_t:CDS:1 n=1 Tax=Racocetra persica TaxID=160502 RepID=A0ACA9L7V3_9GLOM|nr:24498_t:CDS:2 [Racocetra persica]